MTKPADRECLKRAFLDVANLLDAVGVGYFLIQGTALGAYRDSDFTPNERDVDIGFVWEAFYRHAYELAHQMAAREWEFCTISRPFSKLRSIKALRHGIHIDMNSYIRWKDDYFCCSNLKEYSIVHPASQFQKFETVKLCGRVCFIPSPAEEYLAREYGDDWRTPKESHVSASRVYGYRKAQGITDGLLDL